MLLGFLWAFSKLAARVEKLRLEKQSSLPRKTHGRRVEYTRHNHYTTLPVLPVTRVEWEQPRP